MSTDRELLELAAKAAGFTLRFNSLGDVDARWPWNPLTDDGDALRLAIDLGIHVKFDTWNKQALVSTIDFVCYEEAKTADRYAATRRAIVRAAAEIGRNME